MKWSVDEFIQTDTVVMMMKIFAFHTIFSVILFSLLLRPIVLINQRASAAETTRYIVALTRARHYCGDVTGQVSLPPVVVRGITGHLLSVPPAVRPALFVWRL